MSQTLQSPPGAKRSDRLADRARILYLTIPSATITLLLIIGHYISSAISDDFARRLARQYSIEAAANFQIYMNPHLALLMQTSRSTTIARWLDDDGDIEKRNAAFHEIMGYAIFSPGTYLMFTAYDTMRAHTFYTHLAPEQFEPWGQVRLYVEAAQWFLDTRDAESLFILNIQHDRLLDDIHLWLNHRVYYQGRFVGVVTVGLYLDGLFDRLFGFYREGYIRGYLIDRHGNVRLDSSMFGIPELREIGEALGNPVLAERIGEHLSMIDDGAFRLDRHDNDAIPLSQGAFRYASISPIIGTDWSVVVLSTHVDVFGGRYMPMILFAIAALVLCVVIGSALVRRVVLVPLKNLTASAAGAADIAEQSDLFGLDRSDEIGDLSRTVQFMRDSLKKAMAEMQRIEVAAETQRRMAAEDANRAKTRFLARMSHEIRTPMNAVLGVAEIELRTKTLPPQTEEAFSRIYRSASLLLGIINDILDLAKVESDKMEIVPVVYDTADMIADVVQLNMMLADSKKFSFELVVDEALPEQMVGDEIRIKQIMTNLLSNAFKYTREGVVSLSFWVEADALEPGDVTLAVCVRDTGQGMTAKQLESLFDEEFVRFNMEGNRDIEGTGLGMTIVHSLVRMMGGEIKAESSPNKGSVFTVRLPQKANGDRVLGAEIAASLSRSEVAGKHLKTTEKFTLGAMPYGRVLVVDDVDINLYVAEGILAAYDIEVDTAISGFEALAKVKGGETYDIIFMDHMMPGMDGIAATKALREMGYDQPIVALTANALKDMSKLFMSNGFSGFISKPIDIDKLNKYLARFIRDKHLGNGGAPGMA